MADKGNTPKPRYKRKATAKTEAVEGKVTSNPVGATSPGDTPLPKKKRTQTKKVIAKKEKERLEKASTPRLNRSQALEADREKIRDAQLLESLLAVCNGEPLAIRDALGNVVGVTDVPELDVRVKTMTALIRKILPDVQASTVEVGANPDGAPLQLVLSPGVVPPRTGDTIDVTPEDKAIEHKDSVDIMNFRGSKAKTGGDV